MKRPRGTGSILRMNGSSVLWIKYHRNGKPIRESAHTNKIKEAREAPEAAIGGNLDWDICGP